jgi:hypothetical protein
MRSLLFSCALAACGGAAAQASPQPASPSTPETTYAIQMDRPSHVGSRTHVVLDDIQDMTTTSQKGDAPAERKHEHKETHFDAIATTVAVNAKNDSTILHYDVTDLAVNGRSIYKGPVELTRAAKADDATVLVDGAPAEEPLRGALKDVLPCRVGGPSDDEVFGTKERQAVGAHWPMDGDAAAADLANDPGITASTVTGETTLAAVTDGCFDLRAKLHMGGLGLRSAPRGSTVDGDMDAAYEVRVPTDVSRGRLEDHMTMHMGIKIRVKTPNGPVIVSTEMKMQRDGHYVPATDAVESPSGAVHDL